MNILYAHRADPSTPLEEQIMAFNQQIEQGRCQAVSTTSVCVTSTSSNADFLAVGSIQCSASDARTDVTNLRGEESTEAKLLSG